MELECIYRHSIETQIPMSLQTQVLTPSLVQTCCNCNTLLNRKRKLTFFIDLNNKFYNKMTTRNEMRKQPG